ncbi:hypothetical protein GMD6S_12280, partial [Streptococcus sp. GMD6S]
MIKITFPDGAVRE